MVFFSFLARNTTQCREFQSTQTNYLRAPFASCLVVVDLAPRTRAQDRPGRAGPSNNKWVFLLLLLFFFLLLGFSVTSLVIINTIQCVIAGRSITFLKELHTQMNATIGYDRIGIRLVDDYYTTTTRWGAADGSLTASHVCPPWFCCWWITSGCLLEGWAFNQFTSSPLGLLDYYWPAQHVVAYNCIPPIIIIIIHKSNNKK